MCIAHTSKTFWIVYRMASSSNGNRTAALIWTFCKVRQQLLHIEWCTSKLLQARTAVELDRRWDASQLGCNEYRKTYWRYVCNQTDCRSVRISTSEITINYFPVVKDFLVFYLNLVELYRAPRTNKNFSQIVRSGQVDSPWNPEMILKKV